MFIALFFLGAQISNLNPERVDLKVGQKVEDLLGSCYIADENSRKAGSLAPKTICLHKVALTLHPQNPFSPPFAEIQFTFNGQEMMRIAEGGLQPLGKCFTNVQDDQYLKALLPLSRRKIDSQDSEGFTSQTVYIEFCFDQKSGWFHTSTPRIRVESQRMADAYHPVGSLEIETYTLDD